MNRYSLLQSLFDDFFHVGDCLYGTCLNEQGKAVTKFEIALPGVKKADLAVDLIENYTLARSALQISYTLKGEKYSQKILFGTKVKEDELAVKYEDGVLYVTVTPRKAPEPQKKSVKVE